MTDPLYLDSKSAEADGLSAIDNSPTKVELILLSETFKIFSDPNRLAIISALHGQELCVQELCEATDMNQSAVSHCMRLLRAHRIVRSRRDGRNIYYALDDHHVSLMLSMGLDHIRGDDCDE